jgi:hypothetical protein
VTNYTFDQLLDFTRTTSGTFVGSNGLIQTTPASVNLLLWTQQFDNAAWTKTRTTVTANTTVAPDGTSTADKLVEDTTASSTHFTAQSANYTAGTTYTLSVSVKAAGRNWFDIQLPAALMGTIRNAFFDVSNGTVGTVTSGVTAAIVSLGNGWYRCSVTFTATASAGTGSAFLLANADNSISYTGDGTSGLFIWGAQLEAASAATTYTRNNGGVFPPRFDYDPVTLAPKGILIEEQRTNLLTYSEDFTNAAWGKTNSTVSANAATAPDGTTTADKIVENTATGVHDVRRTVSGAAASTAYTQSIFVKASERTKGQMQMFGNSGGSTVTFDLVAGTATASSAYGGWTSASATITPFGNGWYRITNTATTNVGLTAITAAFLLADAAGSGSYTGDGTSGMFYWGAQFEAGAFATSYIPTVASQVTRAPDICSIEAPNFAPWYNPSEGTLVAEFTLLPRTLSGTTVIAYNGSSNGRWSYLSSASARMNDGTNTAVAGSIATPTAINKTASALSSAGMAISLNGAAPGTSAYVGTFGPQDALDIGQQAGAASINGHIRSIRYYPVRLADFQLQALTA